MEEDDERRLTHFLPHLHLRKLLCSRWTATVASIWIQCTSGSLYTFPIYSPLVKSTLGYTQSTLDTVSVFKDIGGNAGILAGLLYSSLSSSGHSSSWGFLVPGPWVVLLAGAVQNFLGYFFIWASVERVIPRPPVAIMCMFMLIAAHAQSFFNTANVVTAVRNYPGYSGTAVGIMKGFIGLSGAVLVQIYQALMNGDPSSFLLMLSLLPTINPLLLMCVVRVQSAKEEDEKRFLNAFSAVALIIAAYLMVVIIFENLFTFEFALRLLALVVLLLLLISPLWIAIRAHQEDYRKIESSSMDYHRLPGYAEEDHEARSGVDSKIEPGQEGENRNLVQAMRTVEFWILVFATGCGMGSGLATSNNLSQIGGSLGYTKEEVYTMISLWNIWSFLGRFGAGYTSNRLLRSQGWPRPLFMAITLAALSVGHLVFASGLPGMLYAGSVLVGVTYGSQWSLMPTISAEIFGVRHMGTIFNTITMANPIASYIFSVRVIGYIYDKEALKTVEGNTCLGRHCFMLSFIVMASATLLGSLAALALYFRTRDFYKRVIIRGIQGSSRGCR